MRVTPLGPRKVFPLSGLARAGGDVAHVDWISDLYIGRSAASTLAKRVMFARGLQELRQRKLVWTVHNLFTHDSPVPREREMRLIGSFVRRCNGLLFLSQRSMAEFAGLYPTAADIPMRHGLIGHFGDDYPNDADVDRARAALGIAADERVVVLVGRLHAYKGIEELVAAFAAAATSGEVLLIAGAPASPEYGQALQQLVRAEQQSCRGRIVFVAERVPTEAMQDYFNAADVTIMPFRRILNSASLVLAASFGVPVVAPAIGSVPEYVPAEVGWTYDPEREALTEVIRAALDAAPEPPSARAQRMEFVRSHFAWSRLARTAIELYEDILARVPAGG